MIFMVIVNWASVFVVILMPLPKLILMWIISHNAITFISFIAFIVIIIFITVVVIFDF